jgi:hypothetical protein
MSPTPPPLPTDPSVWEQLGPAGGILAFIVVCLWLSREYVFYKAITNKDAALEAQARQFALTIEKVTTEFTESLQIVTQSRDQKIDEIQSVLERQWEMITELTRAASTDLSAIIEKSVATMSEVRALLQANLNK